MLEIEKKLYFFRVKEIWFSDYPFEINGYDSIIFRGCKNNIDLTGFTSEVFTTSVIDLTQDLDNIWKKINKTSRKYINRAIKTGIKIGCNQNYKEFYKMNYSFRERKGLSPCSEKIYFLKKNGTLFIAEFENLIIGGQLCLEDENNIRILLASSKRLEVGKEKAKLIGCANRLIIWHIINYAKAKGIKEIDLGGYYSGDIKDESMEKINYFKRSFGGQLTTHYIYQKDYSKIYKIAKNIYKLKQGLT